MMDAPSVALFADGSEGDAIAQLLSEAHVTVTTWGSPTSPPDMAPTADLTIIIGNSSTVADLDPIEGAAFGTPCVAFFRGLPDSGDWLSRFGKNFNSVAGFEDEGRLIALVRAALAEFVPESTVATIAGASLADRASVADALGFAPYVEAVGEFLLNEKTEPPLTMSVEGSWGSGKSSFMLQLADYLRRRDGLIIEFNAWRHEKAEELWAAFAIEFVRGLKRARKSRLDRLRRELRLTLRRYDWARGSLQLVRAALLLFAITFAAVAVPVIAWFAGAEGAQHLLANTTHGGSVTDWIATVAAAACGAGAGAAWLSAAIPLWRAVSKELGNPLAIDLKQYVLAPDYDAKVAFLDRFHEDLDRVIAAYVDRGQKVFVFIDDLDRCDVPHAAELMQAINLMLSDHGPLVFILGMDREKVAAGLAVKHEKILAYLSTDAVPLSRTVDTLQGLAFGYNFIEKFIQIPFVIPEPTDADIETLLTPLESREKAVRSGTAPQTPTNAVTSSAATGAGTSAAAAARAPRAYVTIDLGADAPVIIDIARMVAPALDRNPRRIKNFVNLFRLRALIADATGLFRAAPGTPLSERLTLQKLGKFVAIELRWPLLLAHLEQEPMLIAELERVALSYGELPAGASARLSYWSAESLLLHLLRAGCLTQAAKRDESGIAQYGLGRLDLLRLLRVSPAVKWRATPPIGELDPQALKMAKRRAGVRLIHRADYVEGVEAIPVALSLTSDTLYYENEDLEASFELARIDEIEFDDETATGSSIRGGGRVLRFRSHGAMFEFILDAAAARQWQQALPPRRLA